MLHRSPEEEADFSEVKDQYLSSETLLDFRFSMVENSAISLSFIKAHSFRGAPLLHCPQSGLRWNPKLFAP